MKKALYSFFSNLFFFLICFFLIDLFISNSILNISDRGCKHIERNYIALKKNCVGKEKPRATLLTTNIFTDGKGLRIKEGHKRSKKSKVYAFGSSFIYGTGLEFEKSVIGILENTHKKYEFYNFSYPYGSPTVHLYNLTNELKSEPPPEKILFFLSMSDILSEISVWGNNDSSGRPMLLTDELFRKANKKEKFIKRNFKLSRSIAHFVRDFFRSIRNRDKKNNNLKVRTTIQAGYTYTPIEKLKPHYTDKNFNIGKDKIKNKINKTISILGDSNIEFNLIIFPFADTLEYGQKYFNWENYAKSLCKKNCNFINSFEGFVDYKNNNKKWYKDLFFSGNEHYTHLGHSILADKVTQKIFNNQ